MIDEPREVNAPRNRMGIAILALIGLLISAYLTLHKYGYIGTIVCGSGNCEVVQTSKYAVFFGLPVPLLGLAGYLLVLVVALVALQPAFWENRAMSLVLFMLADGAFLFSLYLSYLEEFKIHAWCRWCIASACVAILMWVCSLFELPRLRRRV